MTRLSPAVHWGLCLVQVLDELLGSKPACEVPVRNYRIIWLGKCQICSTVRLMTWFNAWMAKAQRRRCCLVDICLYRLMLELEADNSQEIRDTIDFDGLASDSTYMQRKNLKVWTKHIPRRSQTEIPAMHSGQGSTLNKTYPNAWSWPSRDPSKRKSNLTMLLL
jgi:hypothetical protein